ncbi:hypothetical protein, partial [uncultured Brevundimonas sp.]|uniref:hypothetical protein n=1 Tax=uncultured Brevundimonas sp. TaxID=213418 RepID=UPI0025E1E7C6
ILRDLATGQAREHDVLLRLKHGHHDTVTAFECRDRGRPVGVPDVEAYVAKCRRTGVHRPVIVSSTGFTKSALRHAQTESLLCLKLEEVGKFEWLSMTEFSVIDRQYKNAEFQLDIDDERVVVTALIDESGVQYTLDRLGAELMSRDDSDYGLGSHTVQLNFDGPVTARGLTSSGKTIKINKGSVEITFEVVEVNVPLLLYKYGSITDQREFASGDVILNGMPYRMLMSMSADNTMDFVVVPVGERTDQISWTDARLDLEMTLPSGELKRIVAYSKPGRD